MSVHNSSQQFKTDHESGGRFGGIGAPFLGYFSDGSYAQ